MFVLAQKGVDIVCARTACRRCRLLLYGQGVGNLASAISPSLGVVDVMGLSKACFFKVLDLLRVTRTLGTLI